MRIGLVGAGPWAHKVHAPGLAAAADIEFVGVHARRAEAARELAAAHGVQAFDEYSDLLSTVDGVAFAVPPKAQAPMAIEAAEVGKHLILEKPIAATIEEAERLADAASEVTTTVMLTRRFAPEVRDFLADCAQHAPGGATATWLAGSLIGGEYAKSQWRQDEGALLDVGPHLFDLLDASLGPITGVRAATRTEPDLWHVLFEHAGGKSSTAALSLAIPGEQAVQLRVFGEHGVHTLDGRETTAQDAYATLLEEFAAHVAAGRRDHDLDVRRGLHLQRIIAQVQAALT